MIKSAIALLLAIFVPIATFAADGAGYRVRYRGGSIPNLANGTEMRLLIDPHDIRLMPEKGDTVLIPGAAITEVSYGRDVHRRIGTAIALGLVTPFAIGALAALTKSKKHFIGIIWKDGDKNSALMIQCDKKDYRGILAAMEAVSGKKSVNPKALTVKK